MTMVILAITLLLCSPSPRTLLQGKVDGLIQNIRKETVKAPVQHSVRVTAYTTTGHKGRNRNAIMASSIKVEPKHYGRAIALSPDLAKLYKFGDKFLMTTTDGFEKEVIYLDRMPKQWKRKVDFLLNGKSTCKQWGNKGGTLVPLKPVT